MALAVALPLALPAEPNHSDSGKTVIHTLWSEHAQDSYPVAVHLPAGFDSARAALPVIFTLDGEGHLEPMRAAARAAGVDAIVVAIGNRAQRRRDYAPSGCGDQGGGLQRFFDFIRFELIPYLEANYPAGGERVLAGHSLGGLLVTHALLAEPPEQRRFDGYLISDPSYWCAPGYFARLRDGYGRRFDRLGARVHLTWAATDGNGDYARSFAHTLSTLAWTKGEFATRELAGTHTSIVRRAYEEGLRFVLKRNSGTGAPAER